LSAWGIYQGMRRSYLSGSSLTRDTELPDNLLVAYSGPDDCRNPHWSYLATLATLSDRIAPADRDSGTRQ